MPTARPAGLPPPNSLRNCARSVIARERLTEDLSSAELMGPYLEIVNPVLWEIGHIAWFHEYWTLRHAAGRAPLIERGDRLWDSSNVRAQDALASRPARPRRHLSATWPTCSRGRRSCWAAALDDEARYFYDLAIRHEDMHVEALTYMRQTSSNAPPQGSARGGVVRAPARLAGDAAVPGGSWRLGSTASEGFIFDNEKWAHETTLAPFRIARARRDQRRVRGLRRCRRLPHARILERGRLGMARRRATPSVRSTGSPGATASGRARRYRDVEPLAPRRRRRVRQLVRGRGVVPLGRAAPADRSRMGGRRRRRADARWRASRRSAPALAVGRCARRCASRANLDFAFDGPIDVGALAGGDSAFGCRQMIGNVWEWTASDFQPFAGFSADPYVDYSQPWFGTRKVLRGGAWATSARIARPAYRNFFTPDRNDVFAGFRTCAL